MNIEFERLYREYWKKICFLSSLPPYIPEWDALVEWSKAHKKEAVDCIIEMLSEEPSDVVGLCEELFPGMLKAEGFVPLDMWCNTWLVILTAYKNGQTKLDTIDPKEFPDHYKEYKAYHKYMENHYIPWNPFHEDDPNISFEDYKQGKRNDKKLLKKKLKELNHGDKISSGN